MNKISKLICKWIVDKPNFEGLVIINQKNLKKCTRTKCKVNLSQCKLHFNNKNNSHTHTNHLSLKIK